MPRDLQKAGEDSETGHMNRYSRQIILKEIGTIGQERIGSSRIAVVGLGATGGIIAELLARAGAGHLRLIDRDTVEFSNLQRQILYDETDVGMAKTDAAANRLQRINNGIEVEPVAKDLHPDNIEPLLKDCDLIMDGTDNIQTRFLINDFAVKHAIPWIYSGAIGTSGMEMAIIPGKTPCIRCLMPVAPPAGALPACDIAGVLNTVPAIVGSLATTDAFKILTETQPRTNFGQLTVFDAWENSFDHVIVSRREDCTCCEGHQFEYLSARIRGLATRLCGRGSIQINPMRPMEIGLEELARRLHDLGEVRCIRHMIRFKNGSKELSIFNDGRAIIRGVKDEAEARALYSRYIGE
ncbi:MAG TPA: NAD(P)H-binding protein [Methanoregulaceae archaeon]|nr:NAD(P)H-binding protein [Methanoregulaceae archaeon]